MKKRINALRYLAYAWLFSQEHTGKALAKVAILLLVILVVLFFASFSAPHAIALNSGDVLALDSGCPCTAFEAFDGVYRPVDLKIYPWSTYSERLVDKLDTGESNNKTGFRMNWKAENRTDIIPTEVNEKHSASVTVAFPTWKVRVRVSFKVYVSAGNDRDYSYTITGWNSRDIQFRKQKVESGTKGIDKDSPAIPIVESIDFLGVYPIDRVKLDVSVHGREVQVRPDVETEIQFLGIVDVENSRAFSDNTLPTCNVTFHPAEQDPNGYPSAWFTLQDTQSGLAPEKIRYFVDNISFVGVDIPRGTRQPVTLKFYKNDLRQTSRVELWVWDLAGNGPTKCWLRNGKEGFF